MEELCHLRTALEHLRRVPGELWVFLERRLLPGRYQRRIAAECLEMARSRRLPKKEPVLRELPDDESDYLRSTEHPQGRLPGATSPTTGDWSCQL